MSLTQELRTEVLHARSQVIKDLWTTKDIMNLLPPEQDTQQDTMQHYQPLIPSHVNSAQSVFEHLQFGPPITFMQTNSVWNLEDQQHSQPAIPTVANATENSLSCQKHSNPKMLLDTNTAGDMFLLRQLGQPMFPADLNAPQSMFNS